MNTKINSKTEMELVKKVSGLGYFSILCIDAHTYMYKVVVIVLFITVVNLIFLTSIWR